MCRCAKGYRDSEGLGWRMMGVAGWAFVPTGVDCNAPCSVTTGPKACLEVVQSLCIN
jgi:hypothetical protein